MAEFNWLTKYLKTDQLDLVKLCKPVPVHHCWKLISPLLGQTLFKKVRRQEQ